LKFGLTFFIFCFVALGSAFGAECSLEVKPTVIERPDALLEYWDLPNEDVLNHASPPNVEILRRYRLEVRSVIDTDPIELLMRYRSRGKDPADLHNLDIVLGSRSDGIRPMNCIEGLLLTAQIRRNSRFRVAPTEFLAFWLRKEGRLRIYYLTGDAAGIRGAAMSALMERVSADKKAGWEVSANLHNHSFFLERLDTDDPQGVLAPSGNDVRVFRSQVESLDLKAALITDGFDTLRIPAADLRLYWPKEADRSASSSP